MQIMYNKHVENMSNMFLFSYSQYVYVLGSWSWD